MATASISNANLDTIATAADTVSDDDLPAADKRSRAGAIVDSATTTIVKYDLLTYMGGQANVVGHGRGANNVCIAFTEDGANGYGTVDKSEITKVP